VIGYVLAESAGGIGRHVANLAAGVGGVVIGPPSTDRRFGFGSLPGVTFVPAAGPRAVRRALASSGAGLVHAHGMRAGALAALSGHRPLVVTVHNAAPGLSLAGIGYRVAERLVARRADVVLTVSDDLASRMRALGARRVEPAVIAAPVRSFARGVPRPRPLVLAVGRMAAQKGFATLVSAAAGWQDLDAELMIAGEGPLASSLRSQASSLGVAVTFPGHTDEVPALLASADVFVLPSVWEGQPLVLQEALRAGVPVVATRVGGIPALAGPDAALLVPPGDVAALRAAVRSVLTDPALAARLRAAARARAASLPTEADALAAAQKVYATLSVRSLAWGFSRAYRT
jgi:glycosyltransferase involved in cell wall biosynthesis